MYIEINEKDIPNLGLNKLNTLLPVKVNNVTGISRDFNKYLKKKRLKEDKVSVIIEEADLVCLAKYNTNANYIIFLLPGIEKIFHKITEIIDVTDLMTYYDEDDYKSYLREAYLLEKLRKELINYVNTTNHVIIKHFKDFYLQEVDNLLYSILDNYQIILYTTDEVIN